MGRSTKITYRLPCAVIVISGTVRRTLDKDRDPRKTIGDMRPEMVSKTVLVRHQADDGSGQTVTIKGGWFLQYKSSFSFQEDGRLTQASSETTGGGASHVRPRRRAHGRQAAQRRLQAGVRRRSRRADRARRGADPAAPEAPRAGNEAHRQSG
jgi:hypothetical protein